MIGALAVEGKTESNAKILDARSIDNSNEKEVEGIRI